jgi:hypothetical protein
MEGIKIVDKTKEKAALNFRYGKACFFCKNYFYDSRQCLILDTYVSKSGVCDSYELNEETLDSFIN